MLYVDAVTHPLDRPVWSALKSRQAPLALGGSDALRFPSPVSPFIAARDMTEKSIAALAGLIEDGEEASIVEREWPAPPRGYRLAASALCVQMIAERDAGAAGRDFPFEPLGDEDAGEIYALAMLTRPGPFRARTHTLGRFIGLRQNGRLIAMAGERLHLDGYREISAVCTHPDRRGRGIGAALIRAASARIRADGETPFLHSYAGNQAAIGLYRSLGFSVRTEITQFVWARAAP